MEANRRKEIIKALECCYTNNLYCSDCPFLDTGKYIECSSLAISALSLIKELTEENERLNGAVEMYEEERKYHFEMSRKKIAEAKADTVRKMQTEIEARCIKGGIYPAFVKSTIDKVAEEIIKGETK